MEIWGELRDLLNRSQTCTPGRSVGMGVCLGDGVQHKTGP